MMKELRHKAIELLARREHSYKELHQKLLVRGFETDEIEVCLGKLIAEDLLSNERFAEAYVRMRSRNGFGPIRIRQELVQRGIDESLAQALLYGSEIDWCVIATDVDQKKFTSLETSTMMQWAKRVKFLTYRGFEHDQINHVKKEQNRVRNDDRDIASSTIS